MHYNLNRYYDPQAGRFIHQDPIGLTGGVNLFQYAVNPVNWIDPLGLTCNETSGVTNPANIRFSQSSIKGNFSNGSSIDDLVAGLKDGTIESSAIPPIRLIEKDGQMFTLDNRRLEAFRRAGVDVPYKMATPQEAAAESWKFTTKNNGTSIRIRGE